MASPTAAPAISHMAPSMDRRPTAAVTTSIRRTGVGAVARRRPEARATASGKSPVSASDSKLKKSTRLCGVPSTTRRTPSPAVKMVMADGAPDSQPKQTHSPSGGRLRGKTHAVCAQPSRKETHSHSLWHLIQSTRSPVKRPLSTRQPAMHVGRSASTFTCGAPPSEVGAALPRAA
jgi:hypothetical protein